MSTSRLNRTAGVEKAATIVIAVGALIGVIALIAGRFASDDAEAYLDGDTSQTEFVTAITPYLLSAFLQGAATVAAAVLVIIWMYRIASNHRALHRGTTWGPGWAIAGWILPPMLYVIPLLMLSEMWRASDPEVPVGGTWRTGAVNPLLYAWFAVYSVVPLVLIPFQSGDIASAFGQSEEALAEGITGSTWPTVVATVASVLGAVLFVLVARSLGSRHRRLTGESST